MCSVLKFIFFFFFDSEKESLSLIALICICSEGDNYPEAFHTVNCINLWLKLKQVCVYNITFFT